MKKILLLLFAWGAATMSLLAQPVVTTQPTNQIVYGGSNVVFSVVVSGTSPFTYQWQCNGTNLANAIITTVAGNGNAVYNGDGNLADLNSISGSFGLVVDGAGNVFISDFNNSRVRKVDTNGIISTVAGNGTNGFSGDGGFATNACLGNPSGLALDAGGNLYIADFGNNYIRKVDTNGIITTIAGTGSGTYDGDGGAATNASLFNPYGLTFDRAGNLYIADSDNNVIRMINPTGIISTVPVNGLVFPTGVALDSAGDLYIADCNGNTIIKMDTNNVVTTFAGGSSVYSVDGIPAVNSGVNYPRGVAVGANGEVYIAAFYDNRVRVVDTNGIITTVAGTGNYGYSGDNGDALNATFKYLNAMAQDSQGNIYISDFFNNRVRAVTYSGPTLKFSNVTTNLSGSYSVVVSDTSGSVTSSVAMLNVVLPPNIVTQPKSQQILVASNVTFSVSAYGTSPMNYQWQFNGTNISDATNNAFMIGVVTTNDAGNYSVTITNSYGNVTSSNAVLTVLVIPPGFSTQPASQAVPSGSNALFTTVASGSPPFNYQWFFNSTSLDGQTNASLSLPNVTTNQAGAYSISVTSPYGSITSHVATLMVGWLPSITMQPTNQSVLAGNRALLTADVSGVGPLTFQWQLNGTNLPNNLITTIAGNGTVGFTGDGGIATTGRIYVPYGVAADISGNVFFADSGNNRIRKVSTDGVMTTVAGSISGFSGDGGAAIQARLFAPYGVAVDLHGNLYIADTSNNRIRMVDTNGVIITLAGSTSGFSGDGGAATNSKLSSPYGVNLDANGNLLIADTHNYHVRMIGTNGIITAVAGNFGSGFSGDGGDATNTSLNQPQGVAMDPSGNIFIADTLNGRVRKVDAYGIITTIAGNGSTTYLGDGGAATNAGINPVSVAVDNYGDVLIADYNHNRILQVDPYGIITTIAGTGGASFNGDGKTATTATLNHPNGVAIDSYGRILIADTDNNRIRRFGQGPTLVLDAANATNAGNYTLVVNSSFGSVTSEVATLTVLLSPAIVSAPASTTAGLDSNASFTVTASGTAPLAYQWLMSGTNLPDQTGPSLNVANVQWNDAGNYAVIITNNYGSVTSDIVTLTVGLPPSVTSQPTNQTVVVGSNGQLSVAVAGDGPFAYQWQLNGTNLPPIITTVAGTSVHGFFGDGGPATSAGLTAPQRLAMDAAGNLLIDDSGNNRVRRVDTNGIITTIAGTGTFGYSGNGGPATNADIYANGGLGVDGRGNFFIAEFNGGRVCKVDTNDIITLVAGGGSGGVSGYGENISATSATINGAQAVAVDKTGNLFIADYYYYRIRKVGTNGLMTTVAGNPKATGIGGFSGDGGLATNATMGTPYDVAVDSLGNFYIADNANSRIRKVDTNGIINTVIGGGASSADGLQGTNTSLPFPVAVAVDSFNNLYVTSSGRVRKMDTNGFMTTVAGGGNNDPGDYGPATSARFLNPFGLTFDVQGNLYVAEQGPPRIRKVHFNGDPTLNLINATITNAGSYSVMITSPFGSVVSSVATLTVLMPPQQFTSQFASGGLQMQFSGTPNYPYSLESATNLTPPVNWQPILTNPADGNGNWQFTDTNLNGDQKFYRAVGQ
jgi:sugar lactone lactonase YvrE